MARQVEGGRCGHDGDDPAPRAGFWATMRAVLWSFLGIRKRSGYARDSATLDPRAIVVGGLLAGVLLVLVLLAVVRLVLEASRHGGVQ